LRLAKIRIINLGNIEVQYPGWYIVLCLVAGLLVAGVLYYRASYFPTAKTGVKIGLAFIRFLVVSFICFLLLSPVLRNTKEESKKPIVVFAQDQSASISSEMDSNALGKYDDELRQVISGLTENYDVKELSFGEQVRDGIDFQYVDKSSNTSAVLDYIGDLYGDQNLGAIVLATDGIYNEGKDPRYANLSFASPIYTVAMGDTTPDRDLLIRQVFHNNIAYLGDKTSLQVDVNAYNCAGARSKITVYRVVEGKNEELISEDFSIKDEDFFQTIELAIPQDHVGLQRYRVSLTGVQGEKTFSNNQKDVFIDVIDARQKILMLGSSPHPDIAAIRSILSKNKNYEVDAALIKDFKGELADYNFVVIHQLPGKGNAALAILRRINEMKIPKMVIVGSQSNINALNQFQQLVNIKPKAASTNEVQATTNRAFSYYKISDLVSQNITGFPPLNAPFGEYSVAPGAEVLLKQRIGKIDTDYPLLVVGEDNGVKTAVWCAEGLWKWRFFDHAQHENTDIFDELLSKTVQYLSLKEDKRKFRVFQAKNLLGENEEALFDAELYNDSYELENAPEVSMTIVNSNRDAFNFGFSRKNEGYALNAGRLPVDDYTWRASVDFNGEKYSSTGQFSVQAIEKESYVTVADHHLLAQLAANSGGEMINPAEVGNLADILSANTDLKPLYYTVSQVQNAINLKWLFFCLFLLLAIEWALRRYLGTY